MKNLTSLLMIMLLLTNIVCANAVASSVNQQIYVNALTFCELYTKRVLEIGNAIGIDITSVGYQSLVNPVHSPSYENCIEAHCGSGILTIDLDDLNVAEWSDILFYVNNDRDSFMKRMCSCAAAISALEYNLTNGEISQFKTGQVPAVTVFTDVLYGVVDDENILDRAFSSGDVLIYEGNYKYYIEGFIASDGTKLVFIRARR